MKCFSALQRCATWVIRRRDFKTVYLDMRFRQILLGVFILQLLSGLFFVYPVVRLAQWLSLNTTVMVTIATILFFSQLVVRVGLRCSRGYAVRAVKAVADFVLGLSPVLLGMVLVAELVIGLFDIAPANAAIAVITITLAFALFGVIKARRPEVVTVPLISAKIAKPLRFVQISDVHIGSRSVDFLTNVLQQVDRLNCDFLCITGDLIDESGIAAERLKAIEAFSKPIYFCTGNHEHYEDLDEIVARLEAMGVEVLRGRAIVCEEVQVIGFDDHSDPDFLKVGLSTIEPRPELFSILMYHRPYGLGHASAFGVDLQISGHTHNGQIKPFHWVVKTQFKYLCGLHRLGSTHLYVNEGTGTWGPVMRIGTRSEITLFEISPA